VGFEYNDFRRGILFILNLLFLEIHLDRLFHKSSVKTNNCRYYAKKIKDIASCRLYKVLAEKIRGKNINVCTVNQKIKTARRDSVNHPWFCVTLIPRMVVGSVGEREATNLEPTATKTTPNKSQRLVMRL
jgi:hypothetical protein